MKEFLLNIIEKIENANLSTETLKSKRIIEQIPEHTESKTQVYINNNTNEDINIILLLQSIKTQQNIFIKIQEQINSRL